MKDSEKKCYYALDCNKIIPETILFAHSQTPLLISDFSFWYGTINAFMPVINECESETIEVLYATPDIENLEEMLSNEKYSDIYVVYASNKLVENLKSQFGERMDSLEIGGISPMWQISY